MTGRNVPTLYEWVGAQSALERLTETFYINVRADDLIGPIFAHMEAHHPHYVAQFLAEVLGGPAT